MRIPAGKFIIGSNNGDDDEKPQHTLDIPYDFWMARFPVTNEQYSVYVKGRRGNHPDKDWEIKWDHPVVFISWKNAMAYCEWLSGLLKAEIPYNLVLRLPTEAEWEKSARGTKGRLFPWGNIFDKDKCNTSEGKKNSTTSVGLYSLEGDSSYGCADMAGNVWEWTHSLYDVYPYNLTDGRENRKDTWNRVVRGGSFLCDSDLTRCAFRDSSSAIYSDNDLGFRICLAPPLPE